VRTAYYEGFGPAVDAALATHALGWHYDAGVQVVRMIPVGIFERFPDLQVIVGHWGEMALTDLDRVEHLTSVARLPRFVTDTVRRNMFMTPSGMLNHTSLQQAIDLVGVERVMFSTDYPFEPASYSGARTFLDGVELPDDHKNAIASATGSA